MRSWKIAWLNFNTGYMANLSLLSCLLPENGLLLLDRLCHASLIDGARLSGRMVRTYGHKDLKKLEKLLRLKPADQPALIVTDGVFSMDGDIAPLPELVELTRRYGARILLDEAHATGVLGQQGKGTLDYFGLPPAGDEVIQMGTLGKALGAFGAYVVGSHDLIRYLVNKARTFIYTTALPPAICAAAMAALELVDKDPGLRARLWENRDYFQKNLQALGLNVPESETPIFPLVVRDSNLAMNLSAILFDNGILVPAIRPPTVPKGTSRLRFTVMASHTQADLDSVLAALANAKQELGLDRKAI